MSRLLGAIMAGGRSSRFGSDKAEALIGSKALLDHVAQALAPQVDGLIVCGRNWPGLASVPDRPALDQGPLGGLCAALHHASAHGFHAVLTAGCDVLPVPPSLSEELGNGPAVIEGQPLFGIWPVNLLKNLDNHLAAQPNRSMRGWIAVSGARSVPCDLKFHNLNTPEDFALYLGTQGLAA